MGTLSFLAFPRMKQSIGAVINSFVDDCIQQVIQSSKGGKGRDRQRMVWHEMVVSNVSKYMKGKRTKPLACTVMLWCYVILYFVYRYSARQRMLNWFPQLRTYYAGDVMMMIIR